MGDVEAAHGAGHPAPAGPAGTTRPTGLPPRLGARFRLLGVLRRSCGTVDHLAHDDLLDRPAVVTVAPLDPARAELLTRAAGLDHPHLVPVIDLEVDDDGRRASAVVVTDPSDGGDLGERLAAGPLDAVDVLVCGAAVADALHQVHRAGLAHLAVGPASVLFDEEGRARLGGAGLALAAPGADTDAEAGAATDVGDLGRLLLGALAGASGAAPPRAVRRLLHRMTDDPAARPGADEVAGGLRQAALAATAVPVRTGRAGPAARVPRGVVAAAAVATAALLAGTVAAVVTSPVEDVAADGPGATPPALALPSDPAVAGPEGAGATGPTPQERGGDTSDRSDRSGVEGVRGDRSRSGSDSDASTPSDDSSTDRSTGSSTGSSTAAPSESAVPTSTPSAPGATPSSTPAPATSTATSTAPTPGGPTDPQGPGASPGATTTTPATPATPAAPEPDGLVGRLLAAL